MYPEKRKKGPGRPRKNEEIGFIFSYMWYLYLEHITGLKKKPTAISRLIIPEKYKTKDSNGFFPSDTKVINQVKLGKRVPPDWLARKATDRLKLEINWMEHPIRYLADPTFLHTIQIHELLFNLREEILHLIFKPNPHQPSKPFRHKIGPDTLEVLDQHSDIDAFTAILGLVREHHYYGFEPEYHNSVNKAFKIFFRIISQPPFKFVAQELFDNLCTHILCEYTDKKKINKIKKTNIKKHILYAERILKLVDELNLLKSYEQPPLTCVYLAEKQISKNLLDTLWKYYKKKELDKIYHCSEFRIFSSYLRIWERTKKSPMFLPTLPITTYQDWPTSTSWTPENGTPGHP